MIRATDVEAARALRFEAQRVVRICRVVSDLARAEAFYCSALGCRPVSRGPLDPAIARALDVPHIPANEVVVRLGGEEVALVQFALPGRAYPENSGSNDLWFQHLAIVVSDMDAAYARLLANPAWHPISVGGPQALPETDGGVRAFKFRDPDGHPLEFLWLPPGRGRAIWHERPSSLREPPFLGIDHTALAVKSTRRSVDFYRALGMRLGHQSLNHGAAQSHLDGLRDARVRVSALRTKSADAPGLELLAYAPPGRPPEHTCVINLSTDWVTLEATAAGTFAPCAVADPDGHLLLLTYATPA